MALSQQQIDEMDSIMSGGGGSPASSGGGGGSTPSYQAPQGHDYGAVGNVLHTGGDMFRGLGMNFIPDAIGGAMNLPNVATAIYKGKTGNKKAALQEYDKNYQNNPLANQDIMKDFKSGNGAGVAMGLGGEGLSVLLSRLGLKAGTKGAVSGGKAVQEGAEMLRYPTKGAAFKLTEKAAAQASEKGVKGSWDKLFANFQNNMEGKYKITTEMKDAINKMHTDYTRPLNVPHHEPIPVVRKATEAFVGHAPGGPAPALSQLPDIIAKGYKATKKPSNDIFSPLQLLDERLKVGPTYGTPPGMIARILSGAQATPQQKAANMLRTTMSNYLHDIAPATMKGDKLYSRYSKGGRFGGSPASIAGKYIGAPLALGLLGGYIGKPVSDFFMGNNQ